MIVGWNLYRMQKFWEQLALLQLLPRADCRYVHPHNPTVLQEVLHNVFTWYAVITPLDPHLGQGITVFISTILKQTTKRTNPLFHTTIRVSQWYPPIQFLWTRNVGSFCLSPTNLHKCFLQGASLAFWRGSHYMVDGQDISSNIMPGAAQCLALFLETLFHQWTAESVSSGQFPSHAATMCSSGWNSLF